MNYPTMEENIEEITLWNEYYDYISALEEQDKEEDPFIGSYEDYGFLWRDFYA